jgi:hypothetical protein
MIERAPVELLFEDRLIRGFDLVIDRGIHRVKLLKEGSGGIIEFDITDVKENMLGFKILLPYS